jgi:hypothetical protein
VLRGRGFSMRARKCSLPPDFVEIKFRKTRSPKAKQTFHKLAQSWTHLAVELESAQALLNALTDEERREEALQAFQQ